jgi:hypothetical protein
MTLDHTVWISVPTPKSFLHLEVKAALQKMKTHGKNDTKKSVILRTNRFQKKCELKAENAWLSKCASGTGASALRQRWCSGCHSHLNDQMNVQLNDQKPACSPFNREKMHNSLVGVNVLSFDANPDGWPKRQKMRHAKRRNAFENCNTNQPKAKIKADCHANIRKPLWLGFFVTSPHCSALEKISKPDQKIKFG